MQMNATFYAQLSFELFTLEKQYLLHQSQYSKTRGM